MEVFDYCQYFISTDLLQPALMRYQYVTMKRNIFDKKNSEGVLVEQQISSSEIAPVCCFYFPLSCQYLARITHFELR